MPTNSQRALVALSCAGCALLASSAEAQLFPPPGPVVAGGPSLNEIGATTCVQELVGDSSALHIIAAPGSYKLCANIIGVAGKAGIRILSNGVTLDLNGFSLIGVPGSLVAIDVSGVREGIAIFNGGITGWGRRGIDAPGSDRLRLSRLFLHQNASGGLLVDQNAIIDLCVVTDNGGDGINAGASAAVESCIVSGQATPAGIRVGAGSSVRSCTARGTVDVAIDAGNACVIEDSVAARTVSPNGVGIDAGTHSTVTRSTALNNALTNIRVGPSSSVQICASGETASLSTTGIDAAEYCTIRACAVGDVGGTGIDLTRGCDVSLCNVYQPDGTGIRASSENHIRWCLVHDNDSNTFPIIGIHATSSNRIVECLVNQCSMGMLIDGAGNIVDTCHATDNFLTGINVTVSGNGILRSSGLGNTPNFSGVAPVVTVSGEIRVDLGWVNFQD